MRIEDKIIVEFLVFKIVIYFFILVREWLFRIY